MVFLSVFLGGAANFVDFLTVFYFHDPEFEPKSIFSELTTLSQLFDQ
jgi:hypothetical protein